MTDLSRRDFLGAVACAFAAAGIAHTIPAAAIAPLELGPLRHIDLEFSPACVVLRRFMRADCRMVFEQLSPDNFTDAGFFVPLPRDGETIYWQAIEPATGEGALNLSCRVVFGEVRA